MQDSTDMATPPAPRLRTSVEPLLRSVQVLSALDVALTAEGDVPRRLVPRAEALLVAAGLAETLAAAEPAERRAVRAVLRAELRLALRLVEADEAGAAFSETQPALNVAFGDVSAGLTAILTREVVPVLDGLRERLARDGARLLDIGTGIGAVAIGMARHWPRLAVTGLEPLPVIAEYARRAVKAAGPARRVDVRTSRGEDLTEQETYDLILVPSAFIPPAQVDRVVARAVEAMRPGGWLVSAAGSDGDATAAALWRFRTAACGGMGLGAVEASCLLRRHGLADLCFVSFGAGATIGVAAGRRGSGGR